MKATSRQMFALFCATRIDNRRIEMTADQASDFIQRANNGEAETVRKEIIAMGGIEKGKAPSKINKDEFKELYDKAYAAGMKAGEEKIPVPMLVTEHVNQLNDSSPIKRAWGVVDGVCGFASICGIKGTSAFGKWLVKNGKGRKDDYRGGVFVWVGEFGQSLEKKTAFASAFAGVLLEAGVSCYPESRMD
jgi:hypothetical protein